MTDPLKKVFPFVPRFKLAGEDKMNKQPVHVIRFGLIVASIWQNQTRVGERHNVTVTRLFRDGDLWRESTHFGRDDLPLLAKVIDFAHTWIFQQGTGKDTEQGRTESSRSREQEDKRSV